MSLDWNACDTLLLDMDGTLLDLYFDHVVWHEHLPRRYGERYGLSLPEAQAEVAPRLAAKEGSLDWYCMLHWSLEFGLDLPAIEAEVAEHIAFRPGVERFLTACGRAGIRRVLATNAHPTSLDLKLRTSGLSRYLDGVHSSHHYGAPKESPLFWQHLQRADGFEPDRSFLLDDNLAVLRAAQGYGVGACLAIPTPNSRQPARSTEEFPAITCFETLITDVPRLNQAAGGGAARP